MIGISCMIGKAESGTCALDVADICCGKGIPLLGSVIVRTVAAGSNIKADSIKSKPYNGLGIAYTKGNIIFGICSVAESCGNNLLSFVGVEGRYPWWHQKRRYHPYHTCCWQAAASLQSTSAMRRKH